MSLFGAEWAAYVSTERAFPCEVRIQHDSRVTEVIYRHLLRCRTLCIACSLPVWCQGSFPTYDHQTPQAPAHASVLHVSSSYTSSCKLTCTSVLSVCSILPLSAHFKI